MPYIAPELRPDMDKIVELMRTQNVKANGDLNYILFKYCKKYIKSSYNEYKNFIGELDQCAKEIGRRLLVPHEKQKIKDNGDVI